MSGDVRVECRRIHETDSAVLVEAAESGEEVWLPLSAVSRMSFDAKGEGYLLVAEWLAVKRGLA